MAKTFDHLAKRTMSKAARAKAHCRANELMSTSNADGTYPALEYARIALARSLVRDRKAAGLSQQALAELAGVRQETISRLETGKHSASVPTIEKIDTAIKRATKRRGG